MREAFRSPFDGTPQPKEDWLEDVDELPEDAIATLDGAKPIRERTVGPAKLEKIRNLRAQTKKPGEWTLPADFDKSAPGTKEQVAQIKEAEKRAIDEHVLGVLRKEQARQEKEADDQVFKEVTNQSGSVILEANQSHLAREEQKKREAQMLKKSIDARAAQIMRENAVSKAKAEAVVAAVESVQKKRQIERDAFVRERKTSIEDTNKDRADHELYDKRLRKQEVEMAPMQNIVSERGGFWSRLKGRVFGSSEPSFEEKYRKKQAEIDASIRRNKERESFFGKIFGSKVETPAYASYEDAKAAVKDIETQMRWAMGQKRRNLEGARNAAINYMIKAAGKGRTMREVKISEQEMAELEKTQVGT